MKTAFLVLVLALVGISVPIYAQTGLHDCWVDPHDCGPSCMAALESYHQQNPPKCSNAFPGSDAMWASCMADWDITPSFTNMACGPTGDCNINGKLKCWGGSSYKYPYFTMDCRVSSEHGGQALVVAIETDVSCQYPDGFAITTLCSSSGGIEILITDPYRQGS